jgi:monoamine oxidase
MQTEASYDSIIIGSGIAGLYTALELLKKHPRRTVAVYEKHKDLGGRIYTFHQTIQGHALQWEAGAARISEHHTLLLNLLKKYKLTYSPITAGIQYVDTYGSQIQPDAFEPGIPIFLEPLFGLPKTDLQENTIRQLLTRVHGPKRAEDYLIRFPYRAEVDVMRADMALDLFSNEFRSSTKYGTCAEGLSALVEAMHADIVKRGGVFHMEHTLKEVTQTKDIVKTIFERDGDEIRVEASQCILAVTSEALRHIKPFQTWHVLRHLQMEPLLRFYGAFPKEEKVWYEAYGTRIVTSEPIRYMIPGNPEVGSAQMSYTDRQDAEYWIGRLTTEGEKQVGEEMLQELRRLLTPSIPPPYFVKAHAWTHGVTYWLPGAYEPATLSKEAITPFRNMPAVHVCGESFSLRQGWIEGAIEHAAFMLKKLR